MRECTNRIAFARADANAAALARDAEQRDSVAMEKANVQSRAPGDSSTHGDDGLHHLEGTGRHAALLLAGGESELGCADELVKRFGRTFDHEHIAFAHLLVARRSVQARAMAHEPDLLLADEPTAALDPQLADQVISLMLDLVSRTETAAVIVSHDHDRVRARVDREFNAKPMMTAGKRGSCLGTAEVMVFQLSA